MINSLSLESISPSCPSWPNSAAEPNRSLRYGTVASYSIPAKCIYVARVDFVTISGKSFVFCIQAQVEEFEKRLTAVHTKGLENVEGEESEQQMGGETQSQNIQTPQPKKNKRKTTRGDESTRIESCQREVN